jgi:hypothetical protein
MCKKGVLVAADKNQQCLLPWWWERYSSHNSLPVAFVDFGMTADMLTWCSQKGEVISFLDNKVSQENLGNGSEAYESNLSKSRKAWFKKPSAFLLSPFKETVWMDVDCEVLSCIDCIFGFLQDDTELAIWYGLTIEAPEGLEAAFEAETICNSGVVVFKKGSPILHEWADIALNESHKYLGDESILSLLISKKRDGVTPLPEIYNWRICRGFPLYAKIIHWKGEWGKKYILKHGGLKPLLERFPGLYSLY